MGTIPIVNSEGERSARLSSKTSNCSQDDAALSQLMSKDPVLGQVIKVVLGKLDETNKKLDGIYNELRRDLDRCHDQVTKLIDAKTIKDDIAGAMKMIPTVTKKQLEDKRRQIIANCLGLPTILRRIMEQLSHKELINLSLVNKLWNYEARSVLRDQDCLKARIRYGSTSTCKRLVEFATDLGKMRIVPFAGVHLDVIHKDHNRSCQLTMKSLNPSYHIILDRLPWKHLSVEFYGNWWNFKDCPALVLVQRVLKYHGGVLEELSILNSDSEILEFFQGIFQHRSLPSLKILTVHRSCIGTPLPSGFMKALVSCAPNLQKFCLSGCMEFNENLMEGSSAVLVATSGLRPLDEQVCESLIGALRTEVIDMYRDRWGMFDVELLNRFVPMVIHASHTTLKILRMNLLFAVPLTCYGMCLENVTELGIFITEPTLGRIEPHILELVKGFDFTRVFPKLNKVKISDYYDKDFSSDYITGFVERGNELVGKALPDRAINITCLEFDGNFSEGSPPPVIFLAELFPNVQKVGVETTNLQDFPFTLLLEQLGCLKELYIDFREHCSPPGINLDSIFCGIFPEEVAELRKKDDEYLKAVNIVPVMPSSTSMRALRSFTFRYSPSESDKHSPTWIFSKVTGVVGFPRCPNLSVEFRISPYSPKELDHMKPYVTIVTESRR